MRFRSILFLFLFLLLLSSVSAATFNLSATATLPLNTDKCGSHCEAKVNLNNPTNSSVNLSTLSPFVIYVNNGTRATIPLNVIITVQNCTTTRINGSNSTSCIDQDTNLMLLPGNNTVFLWTDNHPEGTDLDWNFNFSRPVAANTFRIDTRERGWKVWAAGGSLDTNLVGYWNFTTKEKAETGGFDFTTVNGAWTNVTSPFPNASRAYDVNGRNTGQYEFQASSLGIRGTVSQAYWWVVKLPTNYSLASGSEQYIFTKQDNTDKVRYGIMLENISGTMNVRFEYTTPAGAQNKCDYAFGILINSTNFAGLGITYDGTNLYGAVDNQTVCNVAASGTSSFGSDCFTVASFQNTVCNVANAGTSMAPADYDEAAAYSRNLTGTDWRSLWGNYTVTQASPANSCTPTYSGTTGWNLNIADRCNITTAIDVLRNNITINGSGNSADYLNITGSIKNYTGVTWVGVNTTCWGSLG